MSRTVTFGIIGGYGATGRVVVSELWKSCKGEILIGGRDLAKGTALAQEPGSRVSAAHLDVLDGRSLDDFCSQYSIIVNCAGPVMVLQDRVAQAAFRRRCHYIDVAGLTFVKERMLRHSRQSRSNLRRMTHRTFDSQFFHEVYKPLHGSRGFDPHTYRAWKVGIKLSHVVAFVLQSRLHDFSGCGLQHRQRLLASVQITSYNSHLGLLRSELL